MSFVATISNILPVSSFSPARMNFITRRDQSSSILLSLYAQSRTSEDDSLDVEKCEPAAVSASRTDQDVGGYDPSERIGREAVNVGDPQLKVEEKEFSVTSILRELAAIQQEGPRKYCILGTRHCSFLHQQIIELL